MHWESHGHRYGIEIDQWLERGLDVIVNARAPISPAPSLVIPTCPT
jgi:ribose 1,5-bisphosphokinase PhnN